MTNWQPSISERDGPRYKAIASAIADDVTSGILPPGAQLPTHRELAYQLGVTVGTVTRAYAEATKLGIVDGEVGRGTFIRDREAEAARPAFGPVVYSNTVNFAHNFPPVGQAEESALRKALTELAADRTLPDFMSYQPNGGAWPHRKALAQWLTSFGMPAAAENLLISAGAQNAMSITFTALTEPGDIVLTEQWTYPGMLSLAEMLRLRIHGVEMDGEGVRPDSFEAACRAYRPKAFYCLPTHQNPTTGTMSVERREQIAAIAKRYDVIIVEDDIYRFFSVDAPPPLSSYWPDGSVFITSASKQMIPSLRVGMLVAPPRLMDRIEAGLRTNIWMASPLMSEVTVRWLSDGTAAELIDAKRNELTARQALMRDYLAGFEYRAAPGSLHTWLKLPETWQGGDAASAALAQGITVTSGEAFAAEPGPGKNYLRLCIGAPARRSDVEAGLKSLSILLNSAPISKHSIL